MVSKHLTPATAVGHIGAHTPYPGRTFSQASPHHHSGHTAPRRGERDQGPSHSPPAATASIPSPWSPPGCISLNAPWPCPRGAQDTAPQAPGEAGSASLPRLLAWLEWALPEHASSRTPGYFFGLPNSPTHTDPRPVGGEGRGRFRPSKPVPPARILVSFAEKVLSHDQTRSSILPLILGPRYQEEDGQMGKKGAWEPQNLSLNQTHTLPLTRDPD